MNHQKNVVLDNVSLINEVADNVRFTILDVKQEFISDVCDANVNKINSFVDVPNKGLVYKMRVISQMNIYVPNKLPFYRLKCIEHIDVKNNFF